MIKKKEIAVFSSILLFAILLSSIVYAAPFPGFFGGGFGGGIRGGSQQVVNFFIDWAEPYLQALLGGSDYTGFLLFEKFLFFLLILALVYLSLSQVDMFSKNRFVIWTISIIVPLLAVRYLSFMWLNTVIMQYQILGIFLVGIIPFLVILFFLHNALKDYPVARKIGWIFFVVIYFGLWSQNNYDEYQAIYFWTGLISLIFLLFDGTIHRYLQKQKWEDAGRDAILHQIAEIDNQIGRIRYSSMPDDVKDRQIRKLSKRREKLAKRVL